MQDQEDEMCKVVNDIGSEMREEITKQKQKTQKCSPQKWKQKKKWMKLSKITNEV